ncbi:signal peptidase II [Pseudoroseomonas ludipueritiae]
MDGKAARMGDSGMRPQDGTIRQGNPGGASAAPLFDGGGSSRPGTWALAASATLLGLALDQASKWWILTAVMDPPRLIPVAPFFNLTLGFNRGVSFGLLAADSPATPWLLSGFALAVLLGFGIWLARDSQPRHGLAAGLIGGGALGNVVDRLRQGAVTDFLDFHWAGYHWPAFNIADTLIFLGAALLVLGARTRNAAPMVLAKPGGDIRHERTRG